MLGLFQDSDFARDLEDSKSSSGCIFGSHTFVPISLMCKKQTSVSHSSTESEIIFLDAGVRMDGIPALDLWNLAVEGLHSFSNQPEKSNYNVQRNLLHDKTSKNKPRTKLRLQFRTTTLNNATSIMFLSNVKSSQSGARPYIFEDHEPVFKMIIKGRSPTMRHVSRSDSVALDWLFDRINLGTKIRIWQSL